MARSTSAETLAPGQRIGPFVLLAPLGAGGSARVWAVARLGQLGFSKRMALKVMRADKLESGRAQERFEREARLLAHLRHENVRAVHDLGSHDGRPYMAMRWVDTSLSELLEHAAGKRLAADVVTWLGIQCCAALSAAHGYVNRMGQRSPILHRDVSPGNILLTIDGHVLLADLAASSEAPSPRAGSDAAVDTRFFGSVGYAAPEALREEALDGRSDLFSLGCVLYEALSGVPAFDGEDERAVMCQVLGQGAVDLAELVPDAPAPLVEVVRRALERDLGRRFQSAGEMQAALKLCVSGVSAFELEEATSAAIGAALGDRIRAREEGMYRAFQSFAPSRLERTDTLPIGASADRNADATLAGRDAHAASRVRAKAVSSVRDVPKAPQSIGRRRVLALALLMLGTGGALYPLLRPASTGDVASVAPPVPLSPSPPPAGTPPAGTPPAGTPPAPADPAPPAAAPDGEEPATTRGAQPAAARTPRAVARPPSASSEKPVSARPATPPEPPPKAFQFRFYKTNPYPPPSRPPVATPVETTPVSEPLGLSRPNDKDLGDTRPAQVR